MPGCADGSDFTGTISAMADAVKQRWKVGDRVCGAVHGVNPIDKEIGTFPGYVSGGYGLCVAGAKGYGVGGGSGCGK